MKFSVVIPAYNAEKYICDAITSVKSQRYCDWELIIIDDGSQDETQRICKIVAATDPRIILICRENSGVSAARNIGIQRATGDYMFFLDSDDRIGENVMETTADLLTSLSYKPDIIFGTYNRFDENTKEQSNYCFDFKSDLSGTYGLSIWKELYSRRPVFSCPIMSQIYQTDFLKSNKILFDTTLFVSEDHDWRYLALSKSRYYYYDYSLFTYYYRENNLKSVTHSPMTYSKFANSHIYLTKWFSKANSSSELNDVKEIVLGLIGEDYANKAVDIIHIQDKEERTRAKELFVKDAHIMKNARFLRYKLSSFVFRTFGIDVYLVLISFRQWLLYKK